MRKLIFQIAVLIAAVAAPAGAYAGTLCVDDLTDPGSGVSTDCDSTYDVTYANLAFMKTRLGSDPTYGVDITILNVHSHPQAGDNWTVSFETKGTADLTIIPDDQATIDDLNFVSLNCGEERTPQILANDIISYPNWSCQEQGQIIHLVNVAAPHTLKFQFGNKIAYAYNNPDSVTDTFSDETMIFSKENLVVGGGQVYLGCIANGSACTADASCCSSICGTDADADGYFSQALGHTGTCQATSKPYTDCYDANANAKPGQTTYFSTNRGDGSFDYNCDGSITKSWCDLVTSCTLSGAAGSCGGSLTGTSAGTSQYYACGTYSPTNSCYCNYYESLCQTSWSGWGCCYSWNWSYGLISCTPSNNATYGLYCTCI